MYISISGTIINTAPRKILGKLAHAEVILLGFDIICQAFGSWTLFGDPINNITNECSKISHLFNVPLLKMVALWGLITIFGFFVILSCNIEILTLVLIYFSRTHSKRRDVSKYTRLWIRRFEYLFRSKKIKKNAIVEVAREFADFFKDLEDNWATSDIACGLILLKREQKNVRETLEVHRLIPENYEAEHFIPRWVLTF
jgi:hypothetical protein